MKEKKKDRNYCDFQRKIEKLMAKQPNNKETYGRKKVRRKAKVKERKGNKERNKEIRSKENKAMK